MLNRSRQTGLSLVELMVGLVVGLIVVAGAGAMYVTTVRGQTYGLRAAKLNQELRATLSIIASDLRRAGYWAGAAVAGSPPTFPANPYALRGATHTDLTVLDGGACLMYSYDLDGDSSAVEVGEVFGFRLNGNVIQMLLPDGGPIETDNCAAGTWSGMTSSDTVVITGLSFSTSRSHCMNATKGISWQVTAASSLLAPCDETAANVTMNDAGVYAAPDPGDLLTEVREVTITLAGRHQSDAAMASTITETVHLANNRMR